MNGTADNIQNALNTWNSKMTEIFSLLTQSPESFRGGKIWAVMTDINTAMKAIGVALLVVFFFMGVIKTCTSFSELKKPEQAVKIFVRFILAQSVVVYGLDLMLRIINIMQGIISTVMNTTNYGGARAINLPNNIRNVIDDVGFLDSIGIWAVSFIGGLGITVAAFLMMMTVYSRFFKLYMYVAISPIPLSTFAGRPTERIGQSFLKSFAGVGMQGVIIMIACIIFSVFAASPPNIDMSASADTIVWAYVGETIFNMIILVGTVKMADGIVKDMMGL